MILWVIWFFLLGGIDLPEFAASSTPIVKVAQEIQEEIAGMTDNTNSSNFSWESLLGQESSTREEAKGLPDLEAPSFTSPLGDPQQKAEEMKKNIVVETAVQESKVTVTQSVEVVADPLTPVHEEALQDLPDPAPLVQIEEVWKYEELTYQDLGGKGGGMGTITPCEDGMYDGWPVLMMLRGEPADERLPREGLRVQVDFSSVAEKYKPTKNCNFQIYNENPGLPNTEHVGSFWIRAVIPVDVVEVIVSPPPQQVVLVTPAGQSHIQPTAEINQSGFVSVVPAPTSTPLPTPVPVYNESEGLPSITAYPESYLHESMVAICKPLKEADGYGYPDQVEMFNGFVRGTFDFSKVAAQVGSWEPQCDFMISTYKPAFADSLGHTTFVNDFGETWWIGPEEN
jgi:hypothetical protein